MRPCAPAGCRTSDSGLIRATAEPGNDLLQWCRVPGYSEATGRRAPVRSAARPLAAVCTPLQYHSKTARLCIMLKNIVHRASEGGLIEVRSATLQRDFLLQNCASCTNRVHSPGTAEPAHFPAGFSLLLCPLSKYDPAPAYPEPCRGSSGVSAWDSSCGRSWAGLTATGSARLATPKQRQKTNLYPG